MPCNKAKPETFCQASCVLSQGDQAREASCGGLQCAIHLHPGQKGAHLRPHIARQRQLQRGPNVGAARSIAQRQQAAHLLVHVCGRGRRATGRAQAVKQGAPAARGAAVPAGVAAAAGAARMSVFQQQRRRRPVCLLPAAPPASTCCGSVHQRQLVVNLLRLPCQKNEKGGAEQRRSINKMALPNWAAAASGRSWIAVQGHGGRP